MIRPCQSPPPADDYADGTWTVWKDTSRLQQSPYLKEVVDFFKQNTRVTLVRILRLAPGAEVQEHTDPTLGLRIERSVIRPTIPVFINDKVTFHLNGKPLGMQQGECWYLNLTDPHWITNESSEERINITIDMEPNA
ncbi:MAG: aspartyl/asparaginyl beta-hydroxylase domain-containing protein [Lewinella sp.]|nr:aspartyl/asparaginyl beta-hydroxylase domain-containing protein [Lewinella sp.]